MAEVKQLTWEEADVIFARLWRLTFVWLPDEDGEPEFIEWLERLKPWGLDLRGATRWQHLLPLVWQSSRFAHYRQVVGYKFRRLFHDCVLANFKFTETQAYPQGGDGREIREAIRVAYPDTSDAHTHRFCLQNPLREAHPDTDGLRCSRHLFQWRSQQARSWQECPYVTRVDLIKHGFDMACLSTEACIAPGFVHLISAFERLLERCRFEGDYSRLSYLIDQPEITTSISGHAWLPTVRYHSYAWMHVAIAATAAKALGSHPLRTSIDALHQTIIDMAGHEGLPPRNEWYVRNGISMPAEEAAINAEYRKVPTWVQRLAKSRFLVSFEPQRGVKRKAAE